MGFIDNKRKKIDVKTTDFEEAATRVAFIVRRDRLDEYYEERSEMILKLIEIENFATPLLYRLYESPHRA